MARLGRMAWKAVNISKKFHYHRLFGFHITIRPISITMTICATLITVKMGVE